MYTPAAFAETDTATMHALMRAASFATLVTTAGGLTATHVPTVLHAGRGPLGTIELHLARPNPQCAAITGGEVLLIFHGPHGYISPAWYEPQVTVPTWNYAAVHAYGRATTLDGDGLRRHLGELVDQYEAPRPTPWRLGDVPETYIAGLQRGIIGFAIEITRLEGKWKMGQNRSDADREGAIRGLRATGRADDAALADEMAARLLKRPASAD